MKTLKSVFTIVLFFAAVSLANAQAVTHDYFLGNWEVLVKDTPQGDVKLPMIFSFADGKLSGKVINPETKEEGAMTSVEMKGEELFATFSAGGYDLTMLIAKKDNDQFTGKLMDMLEVIGTRIK